MDNRENERVMMSLGAGARTMSMLLFADARMAMAVYSLLKRLQKEHILKGGEVEQFEKFLKATDGRFDLVNVPGDIKSMKAELDQAGIRYCMMPDLNPADGMTQIAVFTEDRQKFSSIFEKQIARQMSGGEKKFQELVNLSENNVSFVSLPCEGMERAVQEDLDKLGVNYAMLPDLHVGDGEIQLAVANADLDKVNHWFSLYKDQLLEGKENYQVMSKEEYFNTAKLTDQEYRKTADPKMDVSLKKYENSKTKSLSVEEKLLSKGSVKPEDHPDFEEMWKNPELEKVTIDKKSLVDSSPVATSFMEKHPDFFVSRIPGTYGKNAEYLVLPSENVFQNVNGKTYTAFFEKSGKPLVLNQKGNIQKIEQRKSGKELKQHYDEVKRKMKAAKQKQEKTMSEQLGQAIEKIPSNPMKAK